MNVNNRNSEFDGPLLEKANKRQSSGFGSSFTGEIGVGKQVTVYDFSGRSVSGIIKSFDDGKSAFVSKYIKHRKMPAISILTDDQKLVDIELSSIMCIEYRHRKSQNVN